MTDPNWKPQPGKPAITRDKKTLVTDLERLGIDNVWSRRLRRTWTANGYSFSGEDDFDLVEPTAAILAAHGIDADGKPVAKVTCDDCGGTGLALNMAGEPDECRECHGNTVVDAPAPPTRVDDLWFQAAKDFTSAIITSEGTKLKSDVDPSFDTGRAARYADALMAEVAKREGR